ncbi:MAG: dihydrolipoamide acetyltransferase family protein [Desulfatiglandales bacterium]
MAEQVVMPKLAMAMNEGKVVEWMVNEGDWVERSELLMVIETEKVTHECESPASGYFYPVVELEDTVQVFETVALLAETKEELAGLRAGQKVQVEPVEKETTDAPPQTRPARKGAEKIKISPAARKMAKQHNLDIARITGTGPEGRIVNRDIEKVLAAGEAGKETGEEGFSPDIVDGKKVMVSIPLKGMRKSISDHMHHSLAVSAQLSHMGEIEMTEMVKLRNSLLEKEGDLGVRVSYTDLFVLAVANAIKRVPIVNSSLIDDNEVKIWEDINIGVAVALEETEYLSGLIIPVIKNADSKSLVEISKTLKALMEKANNRKLTPEDVNGGTFTITNVGTFLPGLTFGTPIIPQPQSAILQTSAIEERVVARDGQMVIRPIMAYNLTFDHRVMDGAPAGMFLKKVKELIEDPGLMKI